MAAMAREHPLKKYELTDVIDGKQIAGGAYGVVYELFWHGMRFAGKRIRDYLKPGVYPEKLAEECERLIKMRHPCIVQFIGVQIPNGSDSLTIVMEYLPFTLADTVRKYRSLPDEIAFDILEAVSLGICFLHSENTAHRDLSANNVLLDYNMNAKICDLGMAKILDIDPNKMPLLTQTPGTSIYMPPEAKTESPSYGMDIDIFSFGVLMVHMFYGDWPQAAYTYPTNSQFKIDPNWSKYAEKINLQHPSVMGLVEKCLKKPLNRPKAPEVLEMIRDEKAKVPIYHSSRMKMIEQRKAMEDELYRIKNDHTKDIEISRLKNQIEELTQEKEVEETKSTTLMQQIQNLNGSISIKSSEIQIQNELLAEKKVEIALEKEKQEQLQQQLDQAESTATSMRQRMEQRKRQTEHERNEAWEQLTKGEQVSTRYDKSTYTDCIA